MGWKEKHNLILKNKNDIIEKYSEDIPLREIALIYGVTAGCIGKNLKLWGKRKRRGIKYLLGKIILQE